MGERLGMGAMGVVIRGHDPLLEREVAIKRLFPDDVDDPDACRRFLEEARAMARVEHPHVVKIFDVARQGRELVIAMELLPGPTLRDWLAQRRPWREVLSCFLAAGRGLAAVHEADLVHRDFKPDNLMFGPDGRVRVMDLGLAAELRSAITSRSAGASSSGEASMDVEGSVGYMAPEVLEGRNATERSDQFSFCVSLFEGLTGHRPFDAQTPWAMWLEAASGRRPSVPKEIPRGIAKVLLRGLSPKPGDRFRSMDALLEALVRARPRRRAWGLGAIVLGLAAWGSLPETTSAATPCAETPRTEWIDVAVEGARRNVEPVAPQVWKYADRHITDTVNDLEQLSLTACTSTDAERICAARSEEALRETIGALAVAEIDNPAELWPIVEALVDPCEQRNIDDALRDEELEAALAMLNEALQAIDDPKHAQLMVLDAIARADARQTPRISVTIRLEAGQVLMQTGQPAAALRVLEDAVWIGHSAQLADETARVAIELAKMTLVADVGKYDAEPWLDRASEHLDDSGDVALLEEFLARRAAVYARSDRPVLGEAVMRLALGVRLVNRPGDDPAVAQTFAGVGSMASLNGDLDTAAEYFDEALRRLVQGEGIWSKELAVPIFELGRIEYARKRPEIAYLLVHTALQLDLHFEGERSPFVAYDHGQLGLIAILLGDRELAERHLASARANVGPGLEMSTPFVNALAAQLAKTPTGP